MKEKIIELLKNDEKISFSKIAKDLNTSFVEVLRNAPEPTVRKYPIDKKDELFEILNKWDKVLLLVITPDFVLEIKDKFPKGKYGHGFLNSHDKESSIFEIIALTSESLSQEHPEATSLLPDFFFNI